MLLKILSLYLSITLCRMNNKEGTKEPALIDHELLKNVHINDLSLLKNNNPEAPVHLGNLHIKDSELTCSGTILSKFSYKISGDNNSQNDKSGKNVNISEIDLVNEGEEDENSKKTEFQEKKDPISKQKQSDNNQIVSLDTEDESDDSQFEKNELDYEVELDTPSFSETIDLKPKRARNINNVENEYTAPGSQKDLDSKPKPQANVEDFEIEYSTPVVKDVLVGKPKPKTNIEVFKIEYIAPVQPENVNLNNKNEIDSKDFEVEFIVPVDNKSNNKHELTVEDQKIDLPSDLTPEKNEEKNKKTGHKINISGYEFELVVTSDAEEAKDQLNSTNTKDDGNGSKPELSAPSYPRSEEKNNKNHNQQAKSLYVEIEEGEALPKSSKERLLKIKNVDIYDNEEVDDDIRIKIANKIKDISESVNVEDNSTLERSVSSIHNNIESNKKVPETPVLHDDEDDFNLAKEIFFILFEDIRDVFVIKRYYAVKKDSMNDTAQNTSKNSAADLNSGTLLNKEEPKEYFYLMPSFVRKFFGFEND